MYIIPIIPKYYIFCPYYPYCLSFSIIQTIPLILYYHHISLHFARGPAFWHWIWAQVPLFGYYYIMIATIRVLVRSENVLRIILSMSSDLSWYVFEDLQCCII